MRDTFEVICPYCGQVNEIYVDYSGGAVQQYEEDCQVCCQPWEVHVEIHNDDEPQVRIARASE